MANKSHNMKVPFDPTKIKMDSKVQSIYALMLRLEHDEIVTPSYQRHKVWNDEAKSRLIESLIVKIPIPVFYMDATDEDEWKVVDGLQRLTALKEFLIDKTLKLCGLEYIKELEGYSFDDLPRVFQRRILETDVTVININPGTPEDVKYNIFKRINTGGLPLSGQEIRHALNDGKATPTLLELVKVLKFENTWARGENNNSRMDLNELVLRAFALWFLDEELIYNSTIDHYLAAGMKAINDSGDIEIERKKKNFINAYNTIKKIFGELAFRKIKPASDYKSPVNKNIYEMWMFCLKDLNGMERSKLVELKVSVCNMFSNLLSNKTFGYAVSSRKGDTMKLRNTKLKEKLMDILND
ncbi:DUF262 domain-containing protein [Cedecea davisae]|uniref:DUF262 domain-containing protein n=1 Tax=Cedecea davisae TaxID=158484 RepID=A0ABS6DIJ3_9ENTR|nr:DUF262 domain-containing protein [Cedecea davisae]MBU4682938.1 DUF262 domain-containing protein [Cedecea davisae]MBU4687963.1 DUF262 domain-containing protein [Cedecea davisae]